MDDCTAKPFILAIFAGLIALIEILFIRQFHPCRLNFLFLLGFWKGILPFLLHRIFSQGIVMYILNAQEKELDHFSAP